MAQSRRIARHSDWHLLAPDEDLLLQETNHRCSNDLQLVVSLLQLQSSRATCNETCQALTEAAQRVAILARARAAMNHNHRSSLATALRQVSEALHAQAEPRGILVSMRIDREDHGLAATKVTTLTLVVNELATNAIKHAFGENRSGRINITVGRNAGHDVTIIVDDDGRPFAAGLPATGTGLGLDLAKRLMASVGGLLIPPVAGSKAFELRVPVERT